MRPKILQLWRRVRASYWFVPALMAAGAVVLSLGAVQIDRWLIGRNLSVLPGTLEEFDAESARAFLTTVAGSMITVAGVAFSITMVALSLASSQFGPRLLGNFMRDRGNQVVLGTCIATFLYCLLLLRLLRSFSGAAVPEASLAIALLLTVGSLAVLIYFFHHAAMSIQVGSVIDEVSQSLDRAVERLVDVAPRGHRSEAAAVERRAEALEPRFEREGVVVRAARRGYVEEIDEDRLVEAAETADLLVRVDRPPGRFTIEGKALARVIPRKPGGAVDEESVERVRKAFLLGSRRTTGQDAEFAFAQLVELAVRALSPGINDPFTARQCIDVLGDALARLAAQRPQPRWRMDGEGELRAVWPEVRFGDLLDVAFHQIRQNARGTASVTIRLLERLEDVAERAARDDVRTAVRRHAEMLLRSAEALPEPNDRADVEERYRRVMAALALSEPQPA